MATLTTRELRLVAAILDGLNKARATNTRLGVPTTPDVITVRFPTGFLTVLRWAEGIQSDDPKRQRALERSARHREGYLIDLDATPDAEHAVDLHDPQPVKRSRPRSRIEIHSDPREIDRIARDGIRHTGPGRQG
jgi:hypothetical protein